MKSKNKLVTWSHIVCLIMKIYIMRNLLCILILFVTLTLSSCASVTMLSSAYPTKPADAPIEVFVTKKPSKEYVEIAIIGFGNGHDEAIINAIKVEARKVGADAIIIMGRAGSLSSGHTTGNEASGLTAVAIKYKE